MSTTSPNTLVPSPTNNECFSTLTGHEMVGLAFITEAAYLSIAADLLVLLLVAFNLRRHNYRVRSILRSPLDAYILSLIISDIFQGIGSALIVRWIQVGSVFCGTYCTVQGAFQSLGETSSAMATLVIAIHTFVVIAFRKSPTKMWIPVLIITVIWTYVIVFVAYVASRPGHWNDPTPYWCWIGHQHLAAQLAGEYLWLWIAGLASIVLYVPLFFILRGWCGGPREKSRDPKEVLKGSEIGRVRSNSVIHSQAGDELDEKMEREREMRLEQAQVHAYTGEVPVVTLNSDTGSLPLSSDSSRHREILSSALADSPFHTPYRHTSLGPLSEEPDHLRRNSNDGASSISVPSVAPPTPIRRSSLTPRSSHSSLPNVQPLDNARSRAGIGFTTSTHRDFDETPSDPEDPLHLQTLPTSYSLRILLYPIAYTALVLPLSIARWSSGFSTAPPSHRAWNSSSSSRTTFVAAGIYYLSGFVNAFLVLFVRRSVSLLSPPMEEDDDELEGGGIGDGDEEDVEDIDVEEVGQGGGLEERSGGSARRRKGVSASATSARRGTSAASNTLSGTGTKIASGDGSKAGLDHSRRKRTRSRGSGDSGQIDSRLRTIEVKGEVELPD